MAESVRVLVTDVMSARLVECSVCGPVAVTYAKGAAAAGEHLMEVHDGATKEQIA